MSSSATIVVVEDDPAISDLLGLYLDRDGHEVLLAADGETGIQVIRDRTPDLVILDIGLPGIDGLQMCRQIREVDPSVAVIILTARHEEQDRVRAFELGADDYVTKPFFPRELVGRVRAQLRRSTGEPGRGGAVVEIGPISVDALRREVTLDGTVVALTLREFGLISYLADHPGLALTRTQILQAVWGADWVGGERTVDVHVAQLRRKLGTDLPLSTLRGVGYRFG